MITLENRIRGKRNVILFIFLVYLLILFKVVLFKVSSPLNVIEGMLNFSLTEFNQEFNLATNFVPFKTISNYLFHTDNQNIVIKNIIGNLIIFVPFGCLLPMIARNKLRIVSIITTSFLLSLFFELIQLFSGTGSLDVDDLILNTLGSLLGVIILNIITKVVTLVHTLR